MDTLLYFKEHKKQNNRSNSQDNKQEQIFISEAEEYIFFDFRVVRLALSNYAESLLNIEESGGKKQARCIWKRHREKKDRQLLINRLSQYWTEDDTTECVNGCRFFDRWKFEGYMSDVWLERLLAYAKLSDYVVFGDCSPVTHILMKKAKYMKSIVMYVTEADWNEEMEYMADELYEEYGLAVRIIRMDTDNYKTITNLGKVPCNILDFTHLSGMNGFNTPLHEGIAAYGSKWFDFDSDENKKRKIENCMKCIEYFSVKDMFACPKKYI
jgi:hypothetical protein